MIFYDLDIDAELKTGDIVYRHTSKDKDIFPIGQIGIVDVDTKYNLFPTPNKDFWVKIKTKNTTEPGDEIIMLNDVNYGSISSDMKLKKGDRFTVISVLEDRITRYVLFHNGTEYYVKPHDVAVLSKVEIPDFNEYLLFNNETKIHCDTYKKAVKLLTWLHLKNKTWCHGGSYLKDSHFDNERTYYFPYAGTRGHINYLTEKEHIISYEDAIIYSTQDNKTQDTESDSEIKTQTKEIKMPKLQDLINQIFGGTDYDQKPNYLVIVYAPDGSQHAYGSANSVEEIEQKMKSDYRLIGHTTVAYKISREFTTEIPVVSTKLKVEM